MLWLCYLVMARNKLGTSTQLNICIFKFNRFAKNQDMLLVVIEMAITIMLILMCLSVLRSTSASWIMSGMCIGVMLSSGSFTTT